MCRINKFALLHLRPLRNLKPVHFKFGCRPAGLKVFELGRVGLVRRFVGDAEVLDERVAAGESIQSLNMIQLAKKRKEKIRVTRTQNTFILYV